ncbi:hypothetical protein KL86APRO_30153 [uncultured Alphaproteobacteria bacterium]|uniref:Uncharacterized protein n=1 Tax=uncultured Alphaproteobacteria bacterium TaxID=91750 RepID=A0A212KLZ6_9PROT|nr:hypothetical protein KL86APRO_30153 [uncultured Alphaproteobacteria bacterium]
MTRGYRQQCLTEGYARAAQVARETAAEYANAGLPVEAAIAEREAARLDAIRQQIERGER